MKYLKWYFINGGDVKKQEPGANSLQTFGLQLLLNRYASLTIDSSFLFYFLLTTNKFRWNFNSFNLPECQINGFTTFKWNSGPFMELQIKFSFHYYLILFIFIFIIYFIACLRFQNLFLFSVISVFWISFWINFRFCHNKLCPKQLLNYNSIAQILFWIYKIEKIYIIFVFITKKC